MYHNHTYGRPENVFKFTDDNQIEVCDGILKEMFEHPDVKDRKIVAFSVIGAFRKGKSFFLDFCLRYLYGHYRSINHPNNPLSNPTNWMGDENDPLAGFSWRSGASRDTTGIVYWNDIFLYENNQKDEKIAIVIMDTQGLFDNRTSPQHNSRIFALGTLLSSIQILNISGIIQEDQLEYLHFATEFARFASMESRDGDLKPFQNLVFLIRDWQNPAEFNYGIDGGNEYLTQVLQIGDHQDKKLKSVRKHIHDSFDNTSCCLLPYPGKIVSGSNEKVRKYDGNWGQMDEDFKVEFFKFIENILNPSNLILKEISGNVIKGSEYFGYIHHYFEHFKSGAFPEAQTIYESTVEKQMSDLIAECLDDYRKSINENYKKATEEDLIPVFHGNAKHPALLKFKDTRKMCNHEVEEKFMRILNTKIDELYTDFRNQCIQNINSIRKTKAELERKYAEDLKMIENKRIKEKAEIQKKHEESLNRLKKQREEETEAMKKLYEEKHIQLENEIAMKRAENERFEEEMKRNAIEQQLNGDGIWVKWNVNTPGVPEHAVVGGSDKFGPTYVIRAAHTYNGSHRGVVVGKYSPRLREAWIPYFNKEVPKNIFEILTHKKCTFGSDDGILIPGGWDESGNLIYIARFNYDGYTVNGKLHNGTSYISYAGKEHYANRGFQTLRRIL